MTALDQNPVTNDLLLPNRFRFDLKRAPNVNFWVHRVSLPGFSIPSPEEGTPFVKIPQSGEHIEFEQLGVSFFVDSKLTSYLEIFNWMKSLGKPHDFGQYASLLERPPIEGLGVKSEITVFLLNGAQQPVFQFVYHDAFPTAISGWEMVSDQSGLDRVACHAAFSYTDFDVLPVT